MPLPPYILLDKLVGQTPLETVEFWRSTAGTEYSGVPLAYAGRLDPMASGKLLILIGEECKVQERYHGLDKVYEFRVLFGAASDSGDVLGLITEGGKREILESELDQVAKTFIGDIELPYPVFSSRTVHGKPLHTWAMEGRLNEIKIPTKQSTVFVLTLLSVSTLSREEVFKEATEKIALLPTVTDPRKALGNDFRRPDVLQTWHTFKDSGNKTDIFTVASFTATVSSGTYIRTLSEEIAKALGSTGLAFSIHRTVIGRYDTTTGSFTEKFT